ncbi:hypothetical protein F2P81_005403 [Scophthalmus maximus]|uniref:Uncharacterized protein n=1 Tax=Scophthalmus maximus TaxID=52904 RepID=A0A6A4TG79_SCOMX|nr:hypothetical protein F2P81_005403 [Scophthalmus maximus]
MCVRWRGDVSDDALRPRYSSVAFRIISALGPSRPRRIRRRFVTKAATAHDHVEQSAAVISSKRGLDNKGDERFIGRASGVWPLKHRQRSDSNTNVCVWQ